MKRKLRLKLTLLSVLFLSLVSGCTNLYQFQDTSSPTEVVVQSPIEDKIISSLNNATRDDCITMYTFFAGLSLYIEKTTVLSTTPQFFGLLDKVEKDYGWSKEKYKDLTDVIEADLKAKNLAKPQTIDDTIRKDLVDTFRGYSEACKKAAEAKK